MRQLEPFPGLFQLLGNERRGQDVSIRLVDLPAQLPHDSGKLTVVLDIDETLVHTELVSANGIQIQPIPEDAATSEDVFFMNVQSLKLLVRKRPFLDHFLREAAKRFELIAFTAGAEDYATPLLDHLDPDGTIFRHRLFRQHCINRDGVSFVKDLRVINRSLKRTVLVDNNAHSFFYQLENGIPIASFFNDHTDKALVTLFHFLESLDVVEDVRYVLTKVFGLGAAFGSVAQSSQNYMIMQTV